MNIPFRRLKSQLRFGASDLATDDALRSLWATEGAYRFISLAYALYIHTIAVQHYTHPHLAGMFIGVQCIWTGAVGYGLYAYPGLRAWLVGADQLLTMALMYATWWVAPQSWWDHNQSLPTTMWVVNAVLCAGMLWGVLGGFLSGCAMALVSLHVGGDLSWLERSPTLPVLVSAGLAAGVGGSAVRRSHRQLRAALELRARALERERLAREVHDGVLQVLALVGRKGAQLGGEVAELGEAAMQQERALRALIASHDDVEPASAQLRSKERAEMDLRRELLALASDDVRVSAGSDAVWVANAWGQEVLAAVNQVLVNTRLHAGPGACSFVLLEDLGSDLVVTVRDDGSGFEPGRLERARDEGRMGVSRSIVGRIEALGGVAHVVSTPGDGTEWEFTLPTPNA